VVQNNTISFDPIFVDVSDSRSRRYIEVYSVEYRPQDGSDHDALQERCNHRKSQKRKERE
jgi:hypothetical protein